MAFSYAANPFISQSVWNQITSKVNQPATPRIGQARQSAATPRNPGFTATYKPNPYVSQDQWNSMVPGFRADWEGRQKGAATNPAANAVDLSVYRPGQAQPKQPSVGGAYAGWRESPSPPASAPAIAASSTSQSQSPAAISLPSPPQQQAVSPPSNIIESGPMQGLPEGTKIIRGPQGGFVFPESPPPMFTQQPNGGYRPDVSQQPPLPQGFVPGQHVFSALPQLPPVRQPSFAVTQDPGFSTPPPSIPEPGFSASYTDLMGNVSDQPNYVQRDAFIDLLNQSLLPYQTGNRTGPPQYDIPALLSQANEMAQSGYQNAFAFSNFNANPLAGLFA